MKTTTDKIRLGIAGEYAVMSELLKRDKDAHLALGNAKAVDIFVHTPDGKVLTIEVKTSGNKRFVTNFFQKYPTPVTPHPDFWVIVYFDHDKMSNFYILTHQEMADVQMQRNNMAKWEYVKGVDNVLLKNIEKYKDQWNKV